jgi:hypothetical protein
MALMMVVTEDIRIPTVSVYLSFSVSFSALSLYLAMKSAMASLDSKSFA